MTQKELQLIDALRQDIHAIDKKLVRALERIGVLEQELKQIRQPVNAVSSYELSGRRVARRITGDD